jgi:transcriptional regulator with XRE-family HTH domain
VGFKEYRFPIQSKLRKPLNIINRGAKPMNEFYKNAGMRIRELRELNHYTREKFAEFADISPKFLYEIETGQKGFSAETLSKISKVFQVSGDYLINGTENETDNEWSESVRMFPEPKREKVADLLKIVYELTDHKE